MAAAAVAGSPTQSKPSARELQERVAAIQQKAMSSGLLDEQFTQLQQLQDDDNPDFLEEVVSMFVDDSANKLSKLEAALSSSEPDAHAAELDGVVHQFKGSSSSIGAPRVTAACVDFRAAAQAADVDAMRQHLKAMRKEFNAVSATLAEIMALETQIKAANGAPS